MTKFLSTTLLVGFMLSGIQSLMTAANAQVFIAEPGNDSSNTDKDEEKHPKHKSVEH